MYRLKRVALLIGLLAAPLLPAAGHAGIGDAIKKKAADAANKKADQAIDKATAEKKPPASPAATPADEAAKPAAAGDAPAAAATGKVSEVSTKFDFVPGDSLLFLDDFRQDELGEFPSHWKLFLGTYEIAELDGERWLRCTSDDGRIGMKLAPGRLPEYWTLEFDYLVSDPPGSGITVRGLNKEQYCWEVQFPTGDQLAFRSGAISAATRFEGDVVGRHHVMLMARGPALKAYVDRQRLANAPDISEVEGMPDGFEFRMFTSSKPMITNVRYAAGCRPVKDMLATGKLVTYGIRFATGSDVVLPESAPVLRQVASYLEANPTVRLKITGHTDNVGSAASNLDLSKRRAASVAKVLTEQFAVNADRFATDGKGDTQAVKSNASPEGRAMNRRVEFAKL